MTSQGCDKQYPGWKVLQNMQHSFLKTKLKEEKEKFEGEPRVLKSILVNYNI